jgi:hypothetical protein
LHAAIPASDGTIRRANGGPTQSVTLSTLVLPGGGITQFLGIFSPQIVRTISFTSTNGDELDILYTPGGLMLPYVGPDPVNTAVALRQNADALRGVIDSRLTSLALMTAYDCVAGADQGQSALDPRDQTCKELSEDAHARALDPTGWPNQP